METGGNEFSELITGEIIVNLFIKTDKRFQYDPSWTGPSTESRVLTNRNFLIAFFLFLILYISSAVYGFVVGNLTEASVPRNYNNRLCGVHEEVKDKPYLMILNIKRFTEAQSGSDIDDDHASVCVSECPKENFVYDQNQKKSLESIKEKLICTSDVDIASISSFERLEHLIEHNKCSKWYLKSKSIHNRCTPIGVWEGHESETITKYSLAQAKTQIENNVNAYATEFRNNPLTITLASAIMISVGAILALLFVFLLSKIAVPFLFVSIYIFYSVMVLLIAYLIVTFTESGSPMQLFSIIFIVAFIVCTAIALFHFHHELELTCLLVKESSKAIWQVPASLLIPIIPSLLSIGLVILFTVLHLCLQTITTKSFLIYVASLDYFFDDCQCSVIYAHGQHCDPVVFNAQCRTRGGGPCQEIQCLPSGIPPHVYLFHAINVSGFFWLLAFISAFETMVLACLFAKWFWSTDKATIGCKTIMTYTLVIGRYHMGSVAAGSLFLGISCVLQYVFELAYTALRIEFALIRDYCLYLKTTVKKLHILLDLFSSKTFILCAVHGLPFLTSAKIVSSLIRRNLAKVIIVIPLANWLFVVAEILITVIITMFILAVLGFVYGFDDVGMVIIVTSAVGTFLVSIVIFTIQNVALTTLFLCVVEDLERNDGSVNRPYYMSDNIKQYLLS